MPTSASTAVRETQATANAKRAITAGLILCANRLPEVIQVLIDKALDGDRDSAIYICDRIMGRPMQESRVSIDAQVTLQPSDYHRLSLLQAAIQAVQVIDVPAPVELAPVNEPDSEPADNSTFPTEPDKP